MPSRVRIALVASVIALPFLLSAARTPEGTPRAPFKWVNGRVTAIIIQPAIRYYAFTVVNSETNATTVVRFCDPLTGAGQELTTMSIVYDALKDSYTNGRLMQIGVTDFGFEQSTSGQKMCIDRLIM